MKVTYWLIINKKGAVKTFKNKPSTGWDEVAMHMSVEIPDSVFQRPLISASVKIDGDMNHQFNSETNKDIKDALGTLPNVHLLNIDVVTDKEK